MTPADIGLLLKRILASWPTQALKIDVRGMTIAYAEALLDLELVDATRAVDELRKTEEFIPSIAKIRERAVIGHHGNRRAGAEAWGDVIREVGRIGRGGRPRFEDPVTYEALAAIGGWTSVCASNQADPAPRARFIEVYDHLAKLEFKTAQIAPGAKSRTMRHIRTNETNALGSLVQNLLPQGDEETGE